MIKENSKSNFTKSIHKQLDTLNSKYTCKQLSEKTGLKPTKVWRAITYANISIYDLEAFIMADLIKLEAPSHP